MSVRGLFHSDSVNIITNLVQDPHKTIYNFYNVEKDKSFLDNYVPTGEPDLCSCIQPDDLLPTRTSNMNIDNNNVCPIQLQRMNYHGKTAEIKRIIYRGNLTNLVAKITANSVPAIDLINIDWCNVKNNNFHILCNNLLLISLDEFSNETFIAYAIDTIYQSLKDKSPGKGYIRQGKAEICNGYGVSIMEYGNLGPLSEISNLYQLNTLRTFHQITTKNGNTKLYSLDNKYIIDIVKQVWCTLDFLLSNSNFYHGDLKVSNIVMDNTALKYKYKDIDVDSPLSVKIIDLGKSAITLNFKDSKYTRMFNNTQIYDIKDMLSNYNPDIKTLDRQLYYMITNENYTRIIASRNIGLHDYKSLDLYIFMVSFLSIKEIFYKVFSTDSLISILWKPLWVTEADAKLMYTRVVHLTKNNLFQYNHIFDAISNVKLKYNLSEIIYDTIKTY